MKVRALDDNPGHWEKGQIFDLIEGDHYCTIICNDSKGPLDTHALFDKDNNATKNPADCPDFEVIQ